MTKEEFISSGLLELYATGIATPEETQIVHKHLDRFPELKQELKEIEMSLENYTLSQSVAPSSSVKEQLFNKIFSAGYNKETNKAPVVSMSRKYPIPLFYKSIAAAVFILLIGSMILNYSYFEKYHKAQNALDVARKQLQQKERSNEAMSHDLDVVTSKYAMPVVLNGTPQAPDALAKIFWMKNNGQVYVDPTNLPKAPDGMQYQLWGIVDGKAVNGGMIETSKGIYHIQKMKSFGKADAFAITLERAGGSPAPSMDQIIVSAKM